MMLVKSIKTHFPPALRTTLTTNTQFQAIGTVLAPDSSASYAFFKLNSILATGPSIQATTLVLPGAYGLVYPCGINYLLSTITNDNPMQAARAPYNQFLVLGSRIRLMMLTTGAGNTNPTQVVLLPSADNWIASGLAQTIENLLEQPYARSLVIPPLSTAKGLCLTNSCSTKKIFGLTRNLATNDDPWTGTATVQPLQIATWVIGFNNMGIGVTSAYVVDVQVSVEYDVILFGRNMFGSVAPI